MQIGSEVADAGLRDLARRRPGAGQESAGYELAKCAAADADEPLTLRGVEMDLTGAADFAERLDFAPGVGRCGVDFDPGCFAGRRAIQGVYS